ncbi:hypothetical protein [Pseudomonas sp. NPDC087336]|uniref:hypothetical protein n=1 Tax=Pseudomonas sp. NPDC087336 TaxID=3364436 RepID=UPI003815FB4E
MKRSSTRQDSWPLALAPPKGIPDAAMNGICGETNPLRVGGKRGFDTEGGQNDLRCVESGYAYNNNRLLAAEASPSEPWVDNEDIRVSIDLR